MPEAAADRLRDHAFAFRGVHLARQGAGQVGLHFDERRAEVRVRHAQRFPLQVCLRVLEWILGDHRVPFPDRADVGDEDVPGGRQSEGREQRVDVHVRARRLQLRVRHALDGGVDVTLLHGRELLARDPRLHFEHLGRTRLRLVRRDACELERVGNDLQVRVANGRQLGRKVVLLCGQRQVGVRHDDGVSGRVLEIQRNRRPEDDRLVGEQLQAAQLVRQRRRPIDAGDAIPLRHQRPRAELPQPPDVHAGCVHVTDLLQWAALRRRGARRRRVGQQCGDLPFDALAHQDDPAHVRRIPWDGRNVHPLAGGIAREVLARIDARVHLRGVERQREAEVVLGRRQRPGTERRRSVGVDLRGRCGAQERRENGDGKAGVQCSQHEFDLLQFNRQR